MTEPPVCDCGQGAKRGPSHAHTCPVFLAWSHRPTVASRAARRRVLDRFLVEENTRLRNERDTLRQQVEDMKQEALPHYKRRLEESRADLEEARRLAEVEAERDDARRLARWLYRNGGQQVLDASGGGDTSEFPWLLEDQP